MGYATGYNLHHYHRECDKTLELKKNKKPWPILQKGLILYSNEKWKIKKEHYVNKQYG